jgi:hypothetical protein
MIPLEDKILPLYERPDLSPYLVHLTKNTKNKDGYSAFDNLKSILGTGQINKTGRSGSIKGPNPATCFMDVPFASLKYVLNKRDSRSNCPRYEPYGIVVSKKAAYSRGARPVLYLSDSELKDLKIPSKEYWRVVRFEFQEEKQITWIHEREWRCKGDFAVPSNPYCVLVKTANEAKQLNNDIFKDPTWYKIKPRSIVPLEVICQGLVFLDKK